MRAADWQTDDGAIRLYLGDCLEILPTLEAGSVDAVVTDPPYGISYDASHKKYKNGIDRGKAEWDIAPFDPAPILQLGLPTIMWGGNCFASRLPDHSGWLCWRKTTRNEAKVRQADMELAWTNCVRRSRTYQHLWIGAYRASESGIKNVHPTQKPVAVMEWCVSLLPKATTILDPFMGSGTTGVACIKTGRKFIGIEKDKYHFDKAVKRIKDTLNDDALFTGGVAESQGNIWEAE
jgi:site-specific DNA-methyltransferase (adenine-specific)